MKKAYALCVLCFLLLAPRTYAPAGTTESAQEIIYDLSCAPTGDSDACVGVVGTVPVDVYDTSNVCLQESTVRCAQQYGRYGLALRTKADVLSLSASGPLLYRLQKAGRQITIPTLRQVGGFIYLLWMEEPYRVKKENSSRLMYMYRPVKGGINDWSTPKIVFESLNNTAGEYDTAVQSQTTSVKNVGLHVVMSVSPDIQNKAETLYAFIESGDTVAKSTIDVQAMGEEVIEAVGDSLYLAFVGTIGTHAPDLVRFRSQEKPDRNNVFVASRHLDEETWSPAQLIADTEEDYAHYLTMVGYENNLQVGFVRQTPDYSREEYRQHIIGKQESELTYLLTGNIQRRRTFQTIPGRAGVLIRAWKGRTTEFHLLKHNYTKSEVIRTELPEMGGTYYMVGRTPHVSYIAIERAMPPVELEIRTVQFKP